MKLYNHYMEKINELRQNGYEISDLMFINELDSYKDCLSELFEKNKVYGVDIEEYISDTFVMLKDIYLRTDGVGITDLVRAWWEVLDNLSWFELENIDKTELISMILSQC